jgi:hypothetical protein
MPIKIEKTGRIATRNRVRDESRIAPGDTLELQLLDNHAELSPAPERTSIQPEQGVLVFNGSKETGLVRVPSSSSGDRESEHPPTILLVRKLSYPPLSRSAPLLLVRYCPAGRGRAADLHAKSAES